MAKRTITRTQYDANPVLLYYGGNGLTGKDSAGNVAVTVTGPSRFQPFQNARTNLVPNPSAEIDASGWTFAGTGNSVASSTDWSVSGSRCFKLTAGSGIGASTAVTTPTGMTGLEIRVTPGITYKLSIYVKNSNAVVRSTKIGMVFRDFAGVSKGSAISATVDMLPGEVRRFTQSGTAGVGAEMAYIFVYMEGTGVTYPFVIGDTLLFDAVLYEAAAGFGTYFDGSTQGMWLNPRTGIVGTSHASPSVSHAVPWAEEATTNLLLNPSAENATFTSNITVSGTGATLTRDLAYAYYGGASAKLVGDGSVANQGLSFFTATSLGYTGSARTFIGSAYVRGSGAINMWVRVNYTDASSDVTANTAFTLTDVWTRVITATITTNSAKTVSTIELGIRSQTATALTVYADAAQMEEKALATSYCDGSLGTGYSWSGTANASSSTRTQVLSLKVEDIGHINKERGSIIVWIKRDFAATYTQYPIRVGTGASAGLLLLTVVVNPNGTVSHTWRDGTATATSVTTSQQATTGAWHMIYAEWNGVNQAVSIDNNTLVSGSARLYSGEFEPTTQKFSFGAGDFTDSQVNGLVGPMLVFNRTLSASEITAYYNNPSAYSQNKKSAISTSFVRTTSPNKLQRTTKAFTTPALLHVGGNSLTATDVAGPVTVTSSGALRYQVANGARTNIVPNPTFATNVVGWVGTVGGSVSRVVNGGQDGNGALQITCSTASGGARTPLPTESSSYVRMYNKVLHTIAFDARLISGASDFIMQVSQYDAASTLVGTALNTNFSLTTNWQRYSFTFTPNATGVHSLILRFLRATAVAAVWEIDQVVANEGTSTTYFDGNSTGAVWADPITGIPGTAHSSASFSQGAYWVEEGTTNLLANPSAENAVVTQSAGGSGATLTKDTTYAYIGAASFKLVTNNAAVAEGLVLGALAGMNRVNVTQTFPGQCRIRGSGTVDVWSRVVYTDLSSTDGAHTLATLTDAWQFVTAAAVTSVNTKTIDYVQLHVRTNVQQGITFYVDAAQIDDNKAYTTSYTDGSLGTGYAWTGTAHASSSTRTTVGLTLEEAGHLDLNQGSILVWAYREVDNGIQNSVISTNNTIWNTAGKDGFFLGLTSIDQLVMTWKSGTNAQISTTRVGSIPLGVWNMYYTDWNGTITHTALNDEAAVSGTRDTLQGDMSVAGNGLFIGGNSFFGSYDGRLGPMIIFNRPLTTAERTAYYANPSRYAFNTLIPATAINVLRQDS